MGTTTNSTPSAIPPSWFDPNLEWQEVAPADWLDPSKHWYKVVDRSDAKKVYFLHENDIGHGGGYAIYDNHGNQIDPHYADVARAAEFNRNATRHLAALPLDAKAIKHKAGSKNSTTKSKEDPATLRAATLSDAFSGMAADKEVDLLRIADGTYKGYSSKARQAAQWFLDHPAEAERLEKNGKVTIASVRAFNRPAASPLTEKSTQRCAAVLSNSNGFRILKSGDTVNFEGIASGKVSGYSEEERQAARYFVQNKDAQLALRGADGKLTVSSMRIVIWKEVGRQADTLITALTAIGDDVALDDNFLKRIIRFPQTYSQEVRDAAQYFLYNKAALPRLVEQGKPVTVKDLRIFSSDDAKRYAAILATSFTTMNGDHEIDLDAILAENSGYSEEAKSAARYFKQNRAAFAALKLHDGDRPTLKDIQDFPLPPPPSRSLKETEDYAQDLASAFDTLKKKGVLKDDTPVSFDDIIANPGQYSSKAVAAAHYFKEHAMSATALRPAGQSELHVGDVVGYSSRTTQRQGTALNNAFAGMPDDVPVTFDFIKSLSHYFRTAKTVANWFLTHPEARRELEEAAGGQGKQITAGTVRNYLGSHHIKP